jgi:hypothetical protein
MEQCLNTKELAALLGITPESVRRHRCRGSGPPYIRVGSTLRSRVVYALDDVREWLRDRTFTSTSDETVRKEYGQETHRFSTSES